ncbi:hypothetical protein CKM354_000610900 [Cercospora kikuchii]|uniref:Uncharacterized protein n=1 Tax=Cercospora kikuchii TaxID=84275 RepID=A0A9P3FD30_9PEZI|nr:uncharacterized protein CKM354_000610900 [Cercospora kikuchii]GIZ42858.1 hypothetical protein CKM354_000610900 [Cercospora kikuchii]
MEGTTIDQQENILKPRESHAIGEHVPSSTITGASTTEEHHRLTWSDYGNLAILYALCFCQGIPTGLAGATIPATFKAFLPYGTVALFSLTAIPYCFKLLWAPIIDFCWNFQIGRRMTWVLPTQILSGVMLVVAGIWTRSSFAKVQDGSEIRHETLYISAWLLVCLLGAIQSCVIDGWSVELLRKEKVHWVGSVHTLGSISGTFVAYTLFMFTFKDRLKYAEEAADVLAKFISHWGIFFLGVAALLPLLKREEKSRQNTKRAFGEAYTTVVSICQIRPVQHTIFIHLVARLAFEVNDGATDLKLLDQGTPNSTMALLVLMVMPFDLASAYAAGLLSRVYEPLTIWQVAYMLRLLSAGVAAIVVAVVPYGPPSALSLAAIYLQRVSSVVSGTIMFTTFLQFHLRIADPIASGTYMTILATAQNIGDANQWAKLVFQSQ